jgi:hypothetical protein
MTKAFCVIGLVIFIAGCSRSKLDPPAEEKRSGQKLQSRRRSTSGCRWRQRRFTS